MSIVKRIPVKLFVFVFAYTLISSQASPAWIRSISSNFDVHNFTEEYVNDLEVILGGIAVNDIVKLYAGEASRGWIPSVEQSEGKDGIIITWRAPEKSYLKPCEWLHLGLSLRAGAPDITYAKATWTMDGEPVGVIAFVWQNWVGYKDSSVGDIILPPLEFPIVPRTGEPDTLIVERRWALSENVIPLNNLTQDDPMVNSLKWSDETQTDKLTPQSEPSEMTIPPSDKSIVAVVVQYTVTPGSSDRPTAVFTNEARIIHDPRPQPRLLKPVDNLGERPDLIYGAVNLWATEATGLWDDGIIVTRFEFSRDGGQRWELIGEDDDGAVPTFSTFPGTYQHNWWNAVWDVSKFEEGWYLVRARMMDREENIGEDVVEVYVDPTPPIPVLKGLEDQQVFLEPTEISCATLDEDIVSIVWEVQPKLLYYTKGIPHLDQHDYGVGQANNGNMYCAPTGSAACLKWWADHGYSKLTEDLDGNPLTDTDLVEGLADAMGTSSLSGTSGAGIFDGLRQWVNDRGLFLTVTEHATINPTTIRNELENCKEDVILGILWNTGGGHIVTANSIANFTNEDGTTDIDVMDPWEGGIVDVTMEPNGDVHWPGKNGVQDAALMATVSPIRLQIVKIPWVFIGEELSILWDPKELDPGLYFLRATMTDKMGNQCSSQIVARVGKPRLPTRVVDSELTPEGAFRLEWEKTEPGDFKYIVEYCDDLASGVWRPFGLATTDTSWTGEKIADPVRSRYYRVVKRLQIVPDEDPFNIIHEVEVDETGYGFDYKAEEIPRDAFTKEDIKPETKKDDVIPREPARIHPVLVQMIEESPDEVVPVIILLRGNLQIPRFPDLPEGLQRDSTEGKLLSEEARGVINDLLAQRRRSTEGFLAVAAKLGVELQVNDQFWLINGFLTKVQLKQVMRLLEAQDLTYIQPQFAGEKPPDADPDNDVDDGRARIVSDPYFNLNLTSGYIGLLDTGIRTTHVLFNDPSNVDFIRDCVNGGPNCNDTTAAGWNPEDDCWNHGTSSAAIIVGNNRLGNAYRGVTEITLDTWKIYGNGCGWLDGAAAVRAFQRAIAVFDRVIVGEIQAGEGENGAIALAADNAYDAGAVVVAANGNYGPDPETVASPGLAHKVIGIGAYHVVSQAQYNGQSRGAAPDGRYKPDLQAPYRTETASNANDNALQVFGGTSGATPYGAAAAALMRNWLRSFNTFDNGQVYSRLIVSGDIAWPNYDNTTGVGHLRMPTNSHAWWGKVNVNQGTVINIPINVGPNRRDFKAALWWPEAQAEQHDDIDVHLIDPTGVERAKSYSAVSIFELAEVAGNLAQGAWTVRIKGYNIKSGPQTVYWTAEVHN